MSTVLDYSISPSSAVVSSNSGTSTAAFVVTVRNTTDSDVAISGSDFILITVPIKNDLPNAGDVALTSSPGSITPSSGQSNWSFAAVSVGSNAFRATSASAGGTTLKKGESALFMLSAVTVAEKIGTAEITVAEKLSGHTSSPTTLSVKLTTSELGITSFQAFPPEISPGLASLLSWTTTNPETVTLSWIANKVPGLSPNGQYPVSPPQTTTFTLTVTGKGATLSKQITVSVQNPQILSVTPAPLPSVDSGETVVLTFAVESSSYGVLSTDPQTKIPVGDPDPQGRQSVKVPVTAQLLNAQAMVAANIEAPQRLGATRTFNCTFTVFTKDGKYASDPWSLSFPFNPVRILYFQPRATESFGDAVTLEWSLRNWSRFELTANGKLISDIPQSSTSYRATPSQETTDYVLTAYQDGSGSATATVTVTIAPAAPVGSVTSYVGKLDSRPAGWLVCDGTSYDQNKYPQLFPVLGTPNVPDLRGQFLRGFDPTGKVDPDGNKRVIGASPQQDDFKSHTHPQWSLGDHARGGMADGSYWAAPQSPTGPTGGAETRPKNVAVYWLIYAGPPAV